MLTALLIGVPLGLAAGYLGGWIDRGTGWMTDLGFSLPAIVIVLVVVSVFPHNTLAAMVALGILFTPGVIRITRSAVLQVREDLFVAAARVSGLSHGYIIFHHVFPRIKGVVIILCALLASSAILAQTGLAFLGFLAPLPAPSWGGMVSDGISQISQQPWLIWPPGVITVLTILCFGLLGDASRDSFAETWSGPINRGSGRRASSSSMQLRPPAAPPNAAAANGHSGTAPAPASNALLSVEHLNVAFVTPQASIRAVQDVSFDIVRGEALGLVGESGCGKSVTAMSILGLLPGTGAIESGRILLDGVDLAALSERELRGLRGKEIGLVSQEPMVSLNPVFRVGWQLNELVQRHQGVSGREAKKRVLELLASGRACPSPRSSRAGTRIELSGGMAQRVAIARRSGRRAQAADRRRADDGARRHHPGRDPRSAAPAAARAWDGDPARHARLGRGRRHVRPCRRHVRRARSSSAAASRRSSTHRLHPYTAALLESNPHHAIGKERLPTIPGTVPQPGAWPTGCHFSPRCRYATAECKAARRSRWSSRASSTRPAASITTASSWPADVRSRSRLGRRHPGRRRLDAP